MGVSRYALVGVTHSDRICKGKEQITAYGHKGGAHEVNTAVIQVL